jgi:hypothetical protein
LYFLEIPPEGETLPLPDTKESELYLWNMTRTCIELTHNYGTEDDPDFKVSFVLLYICKKKFLILILGQ